jgi:homoaconitase/3-isopropylmalate dehydratase large subunit
MPSVKAQQLTTPRSGGDTVLTATYVAAAAAVTGVVTDPRTLIQ